MKLKNQSYGMFGVLLFGLVITGVSGCGGAEPPVELVSASGVLTIDGKPAADIMVQLTPNVKIDDRAMTSSAVTDAEGRFELQAQDGRSGAMPGKSKVILSDLLEERPAQGSRVTGPTSRVPDRYTIVTAHSLEVEVSQDKAIEINI